MPCLPPVALGSNSMASGLPGICCTSTSPRQSSADPGGRRRASGQSAPATRRAVSAKCTKGTPSTDQSSPA